jgi:hypothetical protein
MINYNETVSNDNGTAMEVKSKKASDNKHNETIKLEVLINYN